MNHPFQSIMANASSSTAPTTELIPFPPRILLTPEQRASVDAAYAELVGGIKSDVYGQARGHMGPSTEPVAGNADLGPTNVPTRPSLTGGKYTSEEALPLLNSHFFIANVKGAYPIAQINDDGSVKYISHKDFSLKLANLIVEDGRKTVCAEKFWLSHYEPRGARDHIRSQGAARTYSSGQTQPLERLCRSAQKTHRKAPSTAPAYSSGYLPGGQK